MPGVYNDIKNYTKTLPYKNKSLQLIMKQINSNQAALVANKHLIQNYEERGSTPGLFSVIVQLRLGMQMQASLKLRNRSPERKN